MHETPRERALTRLEQKHDDFSRTVSAIFRFSRPSEAPSEPATTVWFGIEEPTEARGTVGLLDPTTRLVTLLQMQLSALADELQQLHLEIANRPSISSVQLHTLGITEISVRAPMSIVLEETEDEALARWPEGRVHGLGASVAEAIASLKANIVDEYLDLTSRDRETLGEIALDTLAVMGHYLQANRGKP